MKEHFHNEICENARRDNETIDYQPDKCECGGTWQPTYWFNNGEQGAPTGDLECDDCFAIVEGND